MGRQIPWDQLTDEQRATVELKMRAAKEMANTELKCGKPDPVNFELRKKPGTMESLGQQTVEGVVCEGNRRNLDR